RSTTLSPLCSLFSSLRVTETHDGGRVSREVKAPPPSSRRLLCWSFSSCSRSRSLPLRDHFPSSSRKSSSKLVLYEDGWRMEASKTSTTDRNHYLTLSVIRLRLGNMREMNASVMNARVMNACDERV
ncbi:hypothetical protein HID58_080327, partial [Brassica napus]